MSGSAEPRRYGLRFFHRHCGRAPDPKHGRPRYALQNRGNKARMFMKTKEEVKMSGSAEPRPCGLRLFLRRCGRAADRKYSGPRYTGIRMSGASLSQISLLTRTHIADIVCSISMFSESFTERHIL